MEGTPAAVVLAHGCQRQPCQERSRGRTPQKEISAERDRTQALASAADARLGGRGPSPKCVMHAINTDSSRNRGIVLASWQGSYRGQRKGQRAGRLATEARVRGLSHGVEPLSAEARARLSRPVRQPAGESSAAPRWDARPRGTRALVVRSRALSEQPSPAAALQRRQRCRCPSGHPARRQA